LIAAHYLACKICWSSMARRRNATFGHPLIGDPELKVAKLFEMMRAHGL